MRGPDTNHVMSKWYVDRTTRLWRRDCINYSCGYYETYKA